MTPRRSVTSRRRTPSGAQPEGVPGHNPWERYGWVIQSVWLVFLVFPVLAIWDGAHAWWLRVLGFALVVVFGLVYALGAQHLDRLEKRCAPRHGWGAAYLAALVVCAGGTVPFIDVGALSFLPFVVAFAMFALPVLWSLAVGVVSVALAVFCAIFVTPDEGTWVLAVIVFAVGSMTAGIRLMTDRGQQYESMSREFALVAERERVARDVHDVLGHSLTVVTVKAELAERLVDIDPDRARAELAEIQVLSRQALAEIRATVGGLRVARLGDELASARTALEGAGIQAHLPDDASAVDPRHRIVLAWVLREATTNVVRHSDADTCWVELTSNRLVVRDDGRGLESRPEGNGIRGLRERVGAAGGTFSLTTGPEGHGTVLEVTL
ncbi:sensor histidine kinase [Terrabacter sp. MAHUQ-38]|uniref:sensor histidine kinase n=1 Tax=unclassified Terrabacter TaxID=2630222 RepID=UPI00351C7092